MTRLLLARVPVADSSAGRILWLVPVIQRLCTCPQLHAQETKPQNTPKAPPRGWSGPPNNETRRIWKCPRSPHVRPELTWWIQTNLRIMNFKVPFGVKSCQISCQYFQDWDEISQNDREKLVHAFLNDHSVSRAVLFLSALTSRFEKSRIFFEIPLLSCWARGHRIFRSWWCHVIPVIHSSQMLVYFSALELKKKPLALGISRWTNSLSWLGGRASC